MSNTIERSTLLKALYEVESKSELVEQFNAKLSGAKGTKSKRYTYLLEQLLYYSHAIIFGHGVQTAVNYRQSFMSVAKNNKLLGLSDKEIEKAFSFLNRTGKSDIKKKNDKKQISVTKTNTIESVKTNCNAKEEIQKLKEQLDTKSYTLSKGQLSEDKETFIKIALVTLSSGATQYEILNSIDLKKYNPTSLIELDKKTIKGYIREIRGHYDYSNRAKSLRQQVKKDPTNKNLKKYLTRIEALAKKDKKDIDVTTAIRKAFRALGVNGATNTRGMIALYKECINTEEE